MKLLLFILSIVAYAQTQGTPSVLKGTGAPSGGLCTSGNISQEYFQTDAASGEEIHRCKSAGVWVKATVAAVQSGGPIFGTSAVGTDSYAVDFSPAFTAYATSSTCGATEVCDGAEVRFRADVPNAGTACFAAATTGLDCKTIKKGGKNQNLQTGDIDAGDIVALSYNRVSDVWQYKSQSSTVVTGTAGGWTLVEQHTASSSASLDFTTCFSSAFDSYVFDLVNLLPATNGTLVQIRVSLDGGATYIATGEPYQWGYGYSNGSTGNGADATDDRIRMGTAQDSSTTGFRFSGKVYLYDPLSTAGIKWFQWDASESAAGFFNRL